VASGSVAVGSQPKDEGSVMRDNPALLRMRKGDFVNMVDSLFDDVKQEIAHSASAQVVFVCVTS
jgi:hypothetical protein